MNFRRALLAGVVIAAVACGGGTTAVIETVDAVTAGNLANEPGTVVLDVRTPQEFAEEHLIDAVNVDFSATDFADRIAALDRTAAYVVYCRSGNRSAQAMDLFRRLEFTDVHEIEGGILAWVAAGLPITGG
ncbi:MAG: rhodanese-like domain-containing protein [Actinomycetota bacterium]